MNGGARIRSLKGLEGSLIVAAIPMLGDHEFYLVRLHKVETSGIWIESQDFTERMMQHLGASASRTTLVLFLPFQHLSYIVSSIPSVSLSERALGLRKRPE